MSQILEGDITNICCGTIVHQVNCQGAIGAGVSGAIIQKWPEVESAYRYKCYEQKPEELYGDTQVVQINRDLRVVNLYTQLNYGNAKKTGIVYTDVNRLVQALRDVCKDFSTVYAPYGIGCGLAGADWDDLYTRIKDLPITFIKKV